MNTKQCRELRKAIIERYPPFKEMERLEKSKLTPQEEIALKDLKTKFKKVYKEAKRQYKKTPHNARSVVEIK
jgi:hypothetical protein